ncbi:hypothetical protein GIB67_000681 [Kingdonia uniflora]|uniref:Cytochrome b561 domain-containing protein n=1 Tax=Kingdonia uniflora TaxID=39325 RepID=A0A7J7ND74_9MAGN|nr:hypothetical protein GIB67_000681 [Kingdonia uniflora]
MQLILKSLALVIPTTFLVLLLLPFPLVHSFVSGSSTSNQLKIHKMDTKLSNEITLHGFLLWASMGFLMPVGILIIRMSNTREESGGFRIKVLFYFHVILQVLSVVLATAGAILSIRNFDNAFNNNHQRIGLFLYGVIWIQAFLGFFRPPRETERRNMWFILHWALGTGVTILGLINIYTGLQAYHTKTSRSVNLWTLLFTAEVCFIVFLYLFQDKWDYIRKHGTSFEANTGGDPGNDSIRMKRAQAVIRENLSKLRATGEGDGVV